MSDLAPVYAALRQADAAGDTAGAQRLAAYIKTQSVAPAETSDPSEGGGTLSIGPIDTGIQTPQWLDRTLAGAGKASVDLVRGAGQMLGLESRTDVANARALDAPLMQTTAGRVGNVIGNIADTLPALAIPGAQTVAGAGVLGGTLGLLQPSTSTKETLLNTGIGAAAGAAGQWLGNKISTGITNRLATRQAAADTEESVNAVRDSVLSQSRAEGYVVPPTAVNDSATATALESISGKAATRQAAEAKNSVVSNRLIAQDLGLPANQPITRDALDGVRKAAGAIYGHIQNAGPITSDAQYVKELATIAQVGSDLEGAYPGIGASANEKVKELVGSLAQPQVDAQQALGAFKFLSNRAKASFKAAFTSGGDPQVLEIARAQRQGADAIGDLIKRNLTAQGKDDLAQAWDAARTTIAKSYMAEGALKGNNVDALRLAAQMRKGSYLSGGFKKVAEFGDQFGEVARVPKSGVGVSKLAATVGGGGAVTALVTGQPHLAATLAAASAAPYAVRKGILSGIGQNLLATPDYAPSLIGTGSLNLLRAAGKYGALPGYAAGNALIQSP